MVYNCFVEFCFQTFPNKYKTVRHKNETLRHCLEKIMKHYLFHIFLNAVQSFTALELQAFRYPFLSHPIVL